MEVVEICAGAGGMALGLERAGFEHVDLFEQDSDACATLYKNRPGWSIIEGDVRETFDPTQYKGIDLFAGGVPCPPFSKAGKKLGVDDERDLLKDMVEWATIMEPKVILIENVQGLSNPKFASYTSKITSMLQYANYFVYWNVRSANECRMFQNRKRTIIIAFRGEMLDWHPYVPVPMERPIIDLGAVWNMLQADGWEGKPVPHLGTSHYPTIVGGSKKHGGADLGPKGTRLAWDKLGFKATSVADKNPQPGDAGPPRLTIPALAYLQSFPDEWEFVGSKASKARQIGNAFPPYMAESAGLQIMKHLKEQ